MRGSGRTICAAALGAFAALLPRPVSADPHAAGRLAVALDAAHYGEPAPIDYSFTAGADARVAIGPQDVPITYCMGLDYRLGASIPGGFAYAWTVWPVGAGVVIGEAAFVGLFGGVGLSGVTARVPFSTQAEAELLFLLSLPGPLAFTTAARLSWVAADARQDGAETVRFADEARAYAGLRLGYEDDDLGINGGRGPLFALEVREAFEARAYGIVIAYQIDGIYAP
jgi:hypothetical protein